MTKTKTNGIGISNICTAFTYGGGPEGCIGSRVEKLGEFIDFLKTAIEEHDPAKDRQPGQHYIVLPKEAHATVSSGVGAASTNPKDYVLRFHREKVAAYLKREFALPVEHLAVVVYTMEAYEKDPDCDAAEIARVKGTDGNPPSHVIVAVLASAGPPAPHTPFRLVHNLAGGNLEAEKWTAEEIRAKCKESLAYHNAWSTVAD